MRYYSDGAEVRAKGQDNQSFRSDIPLLLPFDILPALKAEDSRIRLYIY